MTEPWLEGYEDYCDGDEALKDPRVEFGFAAGYAWALELPELREVMEKAQRFVDLAPRDSQGCQDFDAEELSTALVALKERIGIL